MTEYESLLAKQIRNMSGIRSDQPVQPLNIEEETQLAVPQGGKLLYSGNFAQTGTGVPIVYSQSEYNPLGLIKSHERVSAGYVRLVFRSGLGTTNLENFAHDIRRLSCFIQNWHVSHVVSISACPFWDSEGSPLTHFIVVWIFNWKHNQETPGLADEMGFYFELKTI